MFDFLHSTVKKIFKAPFSLGEKIRRLLSTQDYSSIGDDLEQLLIESDLGVATAVSLKEKVEPLLKKHKSLEDIIEEIKKELLSLIVPPPKIEMTTKPFVILMLGANGSGKTTSVAKLAYFYKKEGKKVLLAAADTFRAAAMNQLKEWADKIGIDIVLSQPGGDPAAVVFDALEAAKARNMDVVIVDTAGRLHTKTDLMKELQKTQKVCARQIENAPHQVLLVLDATIGQNALEQANTFNHFVPLSGIFLTKMDGSAKGGIVIPLQKELSLPILWIGTGEHQNDIEPFESKKFIHDLLQ
ncbi:MAG: signal recognition particle-docking protein FtsY [Parachlamydiales bacterium]|nr:signal recognition particle-docking protein FtsY [Parachlamydiales bacterium]